MGYLAKTELLHELYHVGEAKANYNFRKLAVLGFFAGIFIAISSFSYIVVNSGMSALNPTYAKFISGICFSFGLFAVVVSGADLFTGNVLMLAPLLAKKIKLSKMLRNWGFVYLFNFIGSIFIAILVYSASSASTDMYSYLHKIALTKTTDPFMVLLLKGVGCNILVCTGVWMSYACKDITSKFFTTAICVVVFLICGFEHSVANMFYLSLSYLVSDIEALSIFYDLLPVTIGNIIGGAIIAVGYFLAYGESKVKN